MNDDSAAVHPDANPMRAVPPLRRYRLAAYVLALAISLFFSCWNLGGPSFQAEDETHHVTVIQEMLHHGHRWVPQDEAGPYFNKPPLKMWATLPFISLLGEFPFAYRLIDGICGLFTFLLTFYITILWFQSLRVGFISLLTLGGAKLFLFDHGVRSAVQDSPIILGTTLCLWLGWLLLEGQKQGQRPLWWICGITGVSLLIKSAGALLGPLLLCGVWILRGCPRRVSICAMTLALLAAIIPYGMYLGWMQWNHPDAWAISLGREVFSRTADGFQRQHDPFFYLTLIQSKKQGIYGPWLMVALGIALIEGWRQRRVELGYLMLWAIGPLVLFSCAKTRLEWYIAPALPAQAILSGYALNQCWGMLKSRWRSGPLTAPQAIRTVGLFGCLTLGGFGIGSHLWETVPRIIHPTDVLSIDTAARNILASVGPTPIGITLPITELLPGAFERAHLRTVSHDRYLTPNEDAAAFASARLLLVKSEDAVPFFLDFSITGYRSLEPTILFPQQHQRHHWLTLLTRTHPIPPTFLPTRATTIIHTGEETFSLPTGYFPALLGVSVTIGLPTPVVMPRQVPNISLRIHRTAGSTGLVVPCSPHQGVARDTVLCVLPPDLIRQATPSLARIIISPSFPQQWPLQATTSFGTGSPPS